MSQWNLFSSSVKKFRSPYDSGLELKMPYEDSMTICFIMKGVKNYAGVEFYWI